MSFKRSHWCGELGPEDDNNKDIVLTGWIQRTRDHGKLIFIDLRDRTGLIQIVFNYDLDRRLFSMAERLRSEYVIAVRGKVCRRSPDTVNPKLATGGIEVNVEDLTILNPSKTPPFYIEDGINVDENLRLRYRYLDLRRPEMQQKMRLRHNVVKLIRDLLDAEGFLEIETPLLTRSTPEGARDYLVPSRQSQGSFYALPQSPQLFKQLLMVSGMERYFQIARCFRDEDLRADRQPEFTQVDMEVSFADREEIFRIVERMIGHVWEIIKKEKLFDFSRLSYHEAMNRFGSDKPDLRFGMELKDISDLAVNSDFKVFTQAVKKGVVKGLRVPGGAGFTRKQIDDLTVESRELGAKGLAWIQYTGEGWKSPITKFFSPELLDKIGERMDVKENDLLLFVADQWETTCKVLGYLRLKLGKTDNLENEYKFVWIVDFPLLEYSPEESRYIAIHHPFTAPVEEDLQKLETEPLAVRAQAYDLVLNGVEIGGGSIRIFQRDMQERMFKLLGITPDAAQEKFGFLLEAFEYGAPPHGGIAFGLDRLVMLISGDNSIREVIPFPKTAGATCLMTGAPASVAQEQLRDLKISINKEEPEKGK